MLSSFIFSVTFLLISYCLVLLFIFRYWKIDSDIENPTLISGVSVIIAAKNEGQYIEACIKACLDQNTQYPYEVIVINDGSDDNTLSILESFNDDRLVIINNDVSLGKKRSLRKAIEISSFDTLLFTDGDSIPEHHWLDTMNTYFTNKKLKLLSGPIEYLDTRNTLTRFQYLDNINNMAMTNAGIKSRRFYSANGANIMYSKKVFFDLGGYDGNLELASGDDIFMMHKVAEHDASSIDFCAHQKAMVYTQPELTLSSLVQQRKRWATKTQGYDHQGIVVLQGIVFLFVLTIPIGIILSLFFGKEFLLVSITAFIIKSIIDFIYLTKINQFFSVKNPFQSYLKSSIAYLVYILVAGYFAIFPSEYTWKGKKMK